MAFPGMKASEEAIRVMKQRGHDLSKHISRGLDFSTLENSDLIFTMTIEHKRELLRQNPNLRDKVYLLKEYVDEVYRKQSNNIEDELRYLNVTDPIGMSVKAYEETFEELEKAIEDICLSWLKWRELIV